MKNTHLDVKENMWPTRALCGAKLSGLNLRYTGLGDAKLSHLQVETTTKCVVQNVFREVEHFVSAEDCFVIQLGEMSAKENDTLACSALRGARAPK